MKLNLTQRERVLVALLYLVILVAVYNFIGGSFDVIFGDKTNDNIIWFFSGALMIIMGTYIVEPYFTKPSDAIANSIAVLVSLLSITNKEIFFGYREILLYTIAILITSIFSITFKDSLRSWLQKTSKFAYWIVETLGSSKWMFSIIYLSASYSYFSQQEGVVQFVTVIALWVILIFFDIVGWTVKKGSELMKFIDNKSEKELGIAIGCENPFLYKVEMDLTKNNTNINYGALVAIETSVNIGSVGMVIDKKYLLNKRWLSIYLFQNSNGDPVMIDLHSKKLIGEPKSIFAKTSCVFEIELESLETLDQDAIQQNPLFRKRKDFVGYVSNGSNINTINFSVIKDSDEEKRISEGAVLTTTIYGSETLYQVINGSTKEEHLENFDSHGYVVGVARKLGRYDHAAKTLDISKWVPAVYSPLFFSSNKSSSESEQRRSMAQNSIGHLPGTDLEIPIKDIDSIVTHNTAILGILGIGKSYLTFELIKQVSEKSHAKVVCIDITGEYFDELTAYACTPVRLSDDTMRAELAANYTVINKDVHKGGNHAHFRSGMTSLVSEFFDGDEKILVINPEEYDVSKQTNEVKAKKIGPGPADWQDQAPMNDLTIVEITRIISEVVLEYAKNKGKSETAKYLLVFEEAHSLVPEWNSVANEGDKSATNGTAKVILQGRKYGLGSIVVTQRTANVSKSILNQCNTIFALRVFDDTGKSFLSNYIGEDYADTLATLEERHAIAIGKGLRLKQPVIIRLNDREDVVALPVAPTATQ